MAMSSQYKSDQEASVSRKLPIPQKESDPNCAAAAAKLLNCVASKDYSIEKCKVYLEALRACVKKEVRC